MRPVYIFRVLLLIVLLTLPKIELAAEIVSPERIEFLRRELFASRFELERIDRKNALTKKLNQTTVPMFEARQATLREALELIGLDVIESFPTEQPVHSKGLAAVYIHLRPKEFPQESMTLRLRDTPVLEVLRYIAALNNMMVEVDADGVILRPEAGCGIIAPLQYPLLPNWPTDARSMSEFLAKLLNVDDGFVEGNAETGVPQFYFSGNQERPTISFRMLDSLHKIFREKYLLGLRDYLTGLSN